jgi:hypothetical protein
MKQIQASIRDLSIQDKAPDPNASIWTLNDQFSFARSTEYLAVFRPLFTINHLVVKICTEGMALRKEPS